MKELKLGINDISNADYHADTERLSSSNFKTLLEDPDKFYREKILKQSRERKENSAFAEGSYVHALILEPEVIDSEFAFFDGWRKAGKEWEAFKKKHKGVDILSVPQKERCRQLFEAYKKLPIAVELCSKGFSEQTICMDLEDIPVKIRTDKIDPDYSKERGIIVDVKTTGFDADIDSFKMAIDKFGYQLSAALYLEVAEKFYKKPFDFYFVVLSKKEKVCEVFKLSPLSRIKGKKKLQKAMDIYKNCKKTGNWQSPKVPEKDPTEYTILEV